MGIMGFDQSLADRQQQVACLKLAAQTNMTPHCYYADAVAGIIITDFIHAKTYDTNPNNLAKLAGNLQILHHLTNFPDIHDPIFIYTDHLLNQLKSYPLSELLLNYFKEIQMIKQILNNHLTQAACHNDLNIDNILFDGEKFYFIDWEAAGAYDPYFDLATVCSQLNLQECEEEYFLTNYLTKPPNHYQMSKLQLMKQISYCYTHYI